MKLLWISLGCPKNTVDSERMLWLLTQAGYQPVIDAGLAEVAVVNTCAFLESAREEAIEQILELAQFKTDGNLRTLVVAGCLSQFAGDEILKELPEVDGVVGCGRTEEIVEIVNAAVNGQKPVEIGKLDSAVICGQRLLSSAPYTAYLKISEGCDNRCAYCLIPSLRGPFRSAPIEDLVAQARALVADGAVELIVVAQDTTRYGIDLYGRPRLCDLLRQLCDIEGLAWIRLHYLYPELVDDELIELVAQQPKIVKYLDIPIQHVDNDVLTAMNRRSTYAALDTLFTNLRARIPGLTLRTTVMVGFPGEDDEAFEHLYDFLQKHKLERAGVFAFSCEEGTPAADLPDPVDADIAQARAEKLQLLQSDIMDSYNREKKGTTLTVLCEGYDRLASCYYGRSCADSPEIDGKVFFESNRHIPAGQFVSVRITGAIDGDLRGESEGFVSRK